MIQELDHETCYRAIQTRDARFDGRLFVGVTSTRIYCRPVCGARTPRRENVRFYRNAATAQDAGFRPCLRCRPEISPDLSAWQHAPETLSRALQLIESGALDQGNVAGLAQQLSLGERQLRRLFQQHLGVSPIAVAQTRRVLLAKQLLHESRLPMIEVAMAAGFGSVRRFNETFQSLYGRPPASLRRSRATPREATGTIDIRLPYRPPYDWQAQIDFLAARAIPGVEAVVDNAYWRTINIGPHRGVLRVTHAANHRLAVQLRLAHLPSLPEVITRIRRIFDLGEDPLMIGTHLSEDPHLARRVAARPGLRVPGSWDGYELAVRAILGQQISVSAATALTGKLVARYGEPMETGSDRPAELSHYFPAAQTLVAADIAALGMPGARAEALRALAVASSTDPELFRLGDSLESSVARLRALRGIGEWTAQYIAMRALREPDAFPAADIGLMRAMADADGRRPGPAELLIRAERWRPWRAYAALHLWFSDTHEKATDARRAA